MATINLTLTFPRLSRDLTTFSLDLTTLRILLILSMLVSTVKAQKEDNLPNS